MSCAPLGFGGLEAKMGEIRRGSHEQFVDGSGCAAREAYTRTSGLNRWSSLGENEREPAAVVMVDSRMTGRGFGGP